jgi:hypothetical protein
VHRFNKCQKQKIAEEEELEILNFTSDDLNVREHFTQQPNDPSKYKCKQCDKVISATNKHNQSSVRKHLGVVHFLREYLYDSQKGEPAHI